MNKRTKAIKWMKKNPHVLDFFQRFGMELVNAERQFGINLLRERVRYECVYSFSDEYKFPNDVSPYVARHLLWKNPQWSDYMRCKTTQDESDGIRLITDKEIDECDI